MIKDKDGNMIAGVFSSEDETWGTPRDLYKKLDAEYHFTLDPCATHGNHKCDRYYTEAEDGLKQPWFGRVFMNPPYGRQIGKWVKKAWEEAQSNAEIVVCLVPARTDTAWWHDYVMRGEITFLRGRLKFEKADGTPGSSAPFPSAIVVFKRSE